MARRKAKMARTDTKDSNKKNKSQQGEKQKMARRKLDKAGYTANQSRTVGQGQ